MTTLKNRDPSFTAYCSLLFEYPAPLRNISTGEMVQPKPETATLAHVQKVFDAWIEAWEESDECSIIRYYLGKEDGKDDLSIPPVTKIVAFACSPVPRRCTSMVWF